MNRCNEIEPILEEYRVDLLEPARTADVEEHLALCGPCGEALAEIQAIERKLIRLEEDVELPPAEIAAQWNRMERRLERPRRWKEVVPMAAAALLLVGILTWIFKGPSPEPPRVVQERTVSTQERLLATVPKELLVREVAFSPDGSTVAYIARQESPIKHTVVVNGGEPRWYDRAGRLTWSPDGSKLAFIAGFVDGSDAPEFVVVGDQEGERFDGYLGNLTFFSDSKTLVYIAYSQDGARVVMGDKKGEEFHKITDLTTSPDGRTVAYVVQESPSSGWRLVVGHRMDKEEHPRIGALFFSPDGKRLAYSILRQGQSRKWVDFVIRDLESGIEDVLNPRPECDEADLMEFPMEGTAVVATVRSDSRAMLLSGKDWGEKFDNIHSFVRSPNGKNYAYVAVVGNRTLVVRDRERISGKYHAVTSLTFSPDGKSLAYVVHMGGELKISRVIAGKAESEEYDSVESLSFTPDGKNVVFGARRGQELWWKVMEVK